MSSSTALGSEMGNGDKVVNFIFNHTNSFTGTVSTPTSTPTLALQYSNIRRLLSSVTVSTAVASVNFTSLITNQFRHYILEFDSVFPITNNNYAQYRLSQNNGSTWIADYVMEVWGHEGATDSLAQTGAFFTRSNMNSDAWGLPNSATNPRTPLNGFIYMVNPNSTVGFKACRGEVVHGLSAATDYTMNETFSSFARVAGAVNAIQFLFNSGNIASGNFRFYGIN